MILQSAVAPQFPLFFVLVLVPVLEIAIGIAIGIVIVIVIEKNDQYVAD
jgi:hypothetical protein